MPEHPTLFNTDAPWWAKELRQYILWFGPTVVVAMVFLAMWAGWIPSPITENQKTLARVEAKLDGAVNDMKSEVKSSKWSDESMIRLQLQTCRNTSKSEAQMLKCDDYWKRDRMP